MYHEKLWKARGLWQWSWAVAHRPRVTSSGLELRFALIPLEDDSPAQAHAARPPEILCSAVSHIPREELLVNEQKHCLRIKIQKQIESS